MSNWKTQKGDEWCYEGGTIRAAADLNSDDCIFMVRDIVSANGEITEKALLQFLNETREVFSESRIFIKQSRLGVTLTNILTSLQQQGLINYKVSDSSQPLVEVIRIQERKRWSLW